MTTVNDVINAYLSDKGLPRDLELDAAYQLELGVIRSLLGILEASLREEGIDRETALRVTRRMLYGTPDPDADLARWRMRKHEEALAEAMLRPVDPAVVREMMAGIGLPPL